MKFAVVLLTISFLPLITAECKGTAFDSVFSCYKDFMAAYSVPLPTPSTLPDYWTFHNTRQSWFDDQGVKVQQKVCDIGNALISCLQPNWDCIDFKTYEDMGETVVDSTNYKIDLYTTQYQCSPRGLQLAISNFNCMDQARMSGGQDEDEKCNAEFPGDILKYGHCGGENAFLSCMTAIYEPSCGPDGAEFFCGTVRAGLLAVDPTCANKGELQQCPGATEGMKAKVALINKRR